MLDVIRRRDGGREEQTISVIDFDGRTYSFSLSFGWRERLMFSTFRKTGNTFSRESGKLSEMTLSHFVLSLILMDAVTSDETNACETLPFLYSSMYSLSKIARTHARNKQRQQRDLVGEKLRKKNAEKIRKRSHATQPFSM